MAGRDLGGNEFGHLQFTDNERLRIHTLLARRLAREECSSRAGPGGSKLTYLASNKAISLANHIFAFDGWASTVVEHKTDYVDRSTRKKDAWNIGAHAIVRVTLRNGCWKEDIGYGSAINMGKGPGLEKAFKEAVTDGIKRCLRQFGDGLGNCLYDRTFLRNMKSGRERSIPLDTAEAGAVLPPGDRTNLKSESQTKQPETIPRVKVETMNNSGSPTSSEIKRGPSAPNHAVSSSVRHPAPSLDRAALKRAAEQRKAEAMRKLALKKEKKARSIVPATTATCAPNTSPRPLPCEAKLPISSTHSATRIQNMASNGISNRSSNSAPCSIGKKRKASITPPQYREKNNISTSTSSHCSSAEMIHLRQQSRSKDAEFPRRNSLSSGGIGACQTPQNQAQDHATRALKPVNINMPCLDRISEPGQHQQTRVPPNGFQSNDRSKGSFPAKRQQFQKSEPHPMPKLLDPVNTNLPSNQKDSGGCARSPAEDVVPKSETVLFSQDLSDDLLASHAEENWI
mmetsp:Transcript_32587/g.52949  ORF Transcript_32587/g.52949 Transcript_32587/m.52949 type:complete len:513 (-) Transcript_32587:230-1768(-)